MKMHGHEAELAEAMGIVSWVFIALLCYFFLYKSPLVLFWFRPLAPLLERLGFRLIVMDMSFGIHAIRWRREWVFFTKADLTG